MYSLTRTWIACQEQSTQTGVNTATSTTRNNEMPSMPRW